MSNDSMACKCFMCGNYNYKKKPTHCNTMEDIAPCEGRKAYVRWEGFIERRYGKATWNEFKKQEKELIKSKPRIVHTGMRSTIWKTPV